MKDKIIIFDTTLRDGEQSPGASLNNFEKLEIAKQLEKLNVDVIEAGFPVSSPIQFEAVKRIAGEVNKIITGLARAKEVDIKAAYDSLREASKFRIHTFSSTSDIHILGKFGDEKYGRSLSEKRESVLKMSVDAVLYAKTFTEDVEFSAEDAGRTDNSFLAELFEAVIDAGATTINVPDTTGYTFPEEFGKKINDLVSRIKNIDKSVLSVHCHNDLGLAVANSLAALKNGARQIECTINGIGERAGNASLEEIVMALLVRSDINDFYTEIETKEIFNASKMVSSLTGMIVQPNKAIVGENAFAHESGIHQDGVLKDKRTYEIMTPETIGLDRSKIVLGRHSGRHGLKSRLNALGYHPEKEEMDKIYKKFLELADKKKEIFDDDLRVLMGESSMDESFAVYDLVSLQVSSGSGSIPTASVRIKFKDDIKEDSSIGDGPVDACFNAIDRALNIQTTLQSYQVRSVTSGRQALGEVLVRIQEENEIFNGRGVSTDIIEASAKAYISALNQAALYSSETEQLNTKETLTNVG